MCGRGWRGAALPCWRSSDLAFELGVPLQDMSRPARAQVSRISDWWASTAQPNAEHLQTSRPQRPKTRRNQFNGRGWIPSAMCHRLSLSRRRLCELAPEPAAVRPQPTPQQSEPDADPDALNREPLGDGCLNDDLTKKPCTPEAQSPGKPAPSGRGDEVLEAWLQSLGLGHYQTCFQAAGGAWVWCQVQVAFAAFVYLAHRCPAGLPVGMGNQAEGMPGITSHAGQSKTHPPSF